MGEYQRARTSPCCDLQAGSNFFRGSFSFVKEDDIEEKVEVTGEEEVDEEEVEIDGM